MGEILCAEAECQKYQYQEETLEGKGYGWNLCYKGRKRRQPMCLPDIQR